MKKLLALLLCAMLLVSIVPTAAFAAVDLKPAYDALDRLNAAYGQLGAAVAGQVTMDMVRGLFEYYAPSIIEMLGKVKNYDENIIQQVIAWFIAYCENNIGDLDNAIKDYVENFTDEYPYGVSYEELFSEYGPLIYEMHDWAGEQFILAGTIDGVFFLTNQDVDAAIDSLVSDFAS